MTPGRIALAVEPESHILRAIRLAADLEAMKREVQFPEICSVCELPAFLDVPCWPGEASPRDGGAMHMRWPTREEVARARAEVLEATR